LLFMTAALCYKLAKKQKIKEKWLHYSTLIKK